MKIDFLPWLTVKYNASQKINIRYFKIIRWEKVPFKPWMYEGSVKIKKMW